MPSLRFHPGLKLGGERHPALIGGVQAKSRKLTAVWRIFLNADGSALKNDEGKKVKLGLGPAVGGAVRLGPVTDVLRITEGIETGLGVSLLTRPGASTWATLSTSGMINFEIPEGVKRLEIYADGDRHRLHNKTGGLMDPPGIAAAKKLQDRAAKEGVEAVLFPSPEPDDWLDVWQGRKRDERQQRYIEYR
ncbi:toprim domain-containing protein [Rhizobium sp. SSA_523]|uniref:toprim domain-containing protein n=1 Tax=Rhizobium sp. SSA_523 TaxID=2952477 RepID=UPI0020901C29|nr:toprim domain-containing protein [Rhizobium sp. SSA_523]MCO5730128.1 toprim domain-containing protein [Rhizobium sp. SSA_523]WKC25922.1 toprim domain-containing protein [Rhizobium sp. SSA_523]